MIRRQADIRVARPWLLEPKPQPILVAAGDQRETRGGADGRISVALKEAHASRGDAVNIGRGEVAASIRGHVGIAEVVGENKDDVRRLRRRLGISTDGTGRERSCPDGGIEQQSSTRHSSLTSHCRILCSEKALTLSAHKPCQQVTPATPAGVARLRRRKIADGPPLSFFLEERSCSRGTRTTEWDPQETSDLPAIPLTGCKMSVIFAD